MVFVLAIITTILMFNSILIANTQAQAQTPNLKVDYTCQNGQPVGTITLSGFPEGHTVLSRSDAPPPQHLGTFIIPSSGSFTFPPEGPSFLKPGSFTYTAFSDPNHNSIIDPGEVSASITPTIDCSNNPPDCSKASSSIASLWPPNHQLHDISITGITDPNGDPITIAIKTVFQDEPTNGLGDGDQTPDAIINNEMVKIRAERSGTGDGRVYHINFEANDGKGGICTGEVLVSVPHDQAGTAIDSGATFDSTQ